MRHPSRVHTGLRTDATPSGGRNRLGPIGRSTGEATRRAPLPIAPLPIALLPIALLPIALLLLMPQVARGAIATTTDNDPTGDLLSGTAGDPAALDLTSLALQSPGAPGGDGDGIEIVLRFDGPVTPAQADGSGLHGFVDIDVDRDPETGQLSAADFSVVGRQPGLRSGIGSDLQLTFASWDESDQSVDLVDQATNRVLARVPMRFEANEARLLLDEALLPQPPRIHVQAVVGSRRLASDVAPNGGWVSNAEPDQSGPGVPLHDGAFHVQVEWTDFQGSQGVGTAVTSSTDSALFWFFDAENWELLVKVLDGCGFNDRFWVFAAATTNVDYTLRVTQTTSGTVRVYDNPLGNAPTAVNDIEAFVSCP